MRDIRFLFFYLIFLVAIFNVKAVNPAFRKWLVNAQDQAKLTLLRHIAAQSDTPQNLERAELLIQHGTQINKQDVCGQTPLHIAIRYNNKSLIKLLLESGAEVNVQDESKNTPLHLALGAHDTPLVCPFTGVSHRIGFLDEALVENLIEYGAQVNVEGNHSATPFGLLFYEVNTVNEPIHLALLEVFLYAGAYFKSDFLIHEIIYCCECSSNADPAVKIWSSDNGNQSVRCNYLIENHPNLVLHILIKIFKEKEQQKINQESVSASFLNATAHFFSKLGESEFLEKLRFFYANQLLWKWKRKLSQELRNILVTGSIALSFINPKILEAELNYLFFLCQAEEFSQSDLVQELQMQIEEYARAFTQETCRDFAEELLSRYRKNLEKNNLNFNYMKSNQLTGEYLPLAFEFEKFILKFPKDYSIGSKKSTEQYLFNKLKLITNFYTDLQSIINLQGELPDNKKDILSLGFIKEFKNWCNTISLREKQSL